MAKIWGLIVTYRRPAELGSMLQAIARQSLPPDEVLVVDNGDGGDAEQLVQQLGGTYLSSGDNLGPAGGIALGMQRILDVASDDDWLILFDDDDPPPFDTLLAELAAFGRRMHEHDPMTAGVGVLGAVYDRRLGIWRRLADHELRGSVPVDVIHGGRFPLYRVSALRQGGVFDPSLFFGFEEGEFGLRLKSRGYSLYLDGSLAIHLRQRLGHLGLPSEVRTPRTKAAWRRYYGVRNSTILARRYASPWTPVLVACGGAIKGTMALAQSRRPWPDVILPVRGAVDGLLGRTGRTINPSVSSK